VVECISNECEPRSANSSTTLKRKGMREGGKEVGGSGKWRPPARPRSTHLASSGTDQLGLAIHRTS
jgi:hypothetical protein